MLRTWKVLHCWDDGGFTDLGVMLDEENAELFLEGFEGGMERQRKFAFSIEWKVIDLDE